VALPKIADRFNGAIQKSDREQKIAELQAEIDRLRAAHSPNLEAELQALREQLQQQRGEVEIAIAQIEPNPNQPRQTITPESIQAKARLLKKHGQISSVILVPQGEDRYRLLDGQLRWEAAQVLGWETLRAVVVPMPEDLEQSSLLTFLGFEDLNPLDKAEAVFKEVTKTMELAIAEVSTLLGTGLKRIERDGNTKALTQLVALSAEEQQQGLERLGVTEAERVLLSVLLELGLNPASVKANLLPMLSLPPDLKDAIRQKGLKGAHALALATLSDKGLKVSAQQAKKERSSATGKVLKEQLTVPETRELVKQIKAKYLQAERSESKAVKAIVQKMSALSDDWLDEANGEQLQQLQVVLRQRLAQIDQVLEQQGDR
jgi:ParB family transcriptional regulator, chromosome partitioning protein